MKIKTSGLLLLLVQTIFTSEQKRKRIEDLEKLKILYSSKVDAEIIGEMYRDTCGYDMHKTSYALAEMIEEIDAMQAEEERLEEIKRENEIYQMNVKMQKEAKKIYKMNIKMQKEAKVEMYGGEVRILADLVKNKDKSNAEFLIREMQAERQKEIDGRQAVLVRQKVLGGIQKTERKSNSNLLSANLQRTVGEFFDGFEFYAKTEMISKNWSADVFSRITPRAELFEDKMTKEVIFKTKDGVFNEIQLAEILASGSPQSRSDIQKVIQERNWDALFIWLIPKPYLMQGEETYEETYASLGINLSWTGLPINPVYSYNERGTICEDLWEALAEIVTINARLDEITAFGWATLHEAARKNNVNLVKILLKHNAKVDESDGFTTPLIIATKNSNFDIIAELLKHVADPNQQESEKNKIFDQNGFLNNTYGGKTALHYAAENNRPDIIAMLLVYGADIDATDKDWQTPFEAAANSYCPEAMSLLSKLHEQKTEDDQADAFFQEIVNSRKQY